MKLPLYRGRGLGGQIETTMSANLTLPLFWSYLSDEKVTSDLNFQGNLSSKNSSLLVELDKY